MRNSPGKFFSRLHKSTYSIFISNIFWKSVQNCTIEISPHDLWDQKQLRQFWRSRNNQICSWTSDCGIFLLAPQWQISYNFTPQFLWNQAVVSPILFTEWLTCRFCIIILHSMKVISTSVKFSQFIVFTVYSEKVCWTSPVLHGELCFSAWINAHNFVVVDSTRFRGQSQIFQSKNFFLWFSLHKSCTQYLQSTEFRCAIMAFLLFANILGNNISTTDFSALLTLLKYIIFPLLWSKIRPSPSKILGSAKKDTPI